MDTRAPTPSATRSHLNICLGSNSPQISDLTKQNQTLRSDLERELESMARDLEIDICAHLVNDRTTVAEQFNAYLVRIMKILRSSRGAL